MPLVVSLVLFSHITVLQIFPPFCEVSTAWNLITLIMNLVAVWSKLLVVPSCDVESLVLTFIIRFVDVFILLVSYVTILVISLLGVYFVSLVELSGIRVLILLG